MSKYTTELRYICESKAGLRSSVGYADIEQVLTGCVAQIFPNFPIFDEAYRIPLEKKILKHYYTREISEETFGLWKLRLDSKMNEIMPYYNQLYASELFANGYNPFNPVDISRTHVLERKSNTSGTDTSAYGNTASGSITDTVRDRYSDTPQGALNGVENDTYLTNARKVTTDNSSSTSANGNSTNINVTDFTNTDQYVERLVGSYGYRSQSDELTKLRSTFLNIDMMIIDELKDLFFGLW